MPTRRVTVAMVSLLMAVGCGGDGRSETPSAGSASVVASDPAGALIWFVDGSATWPPPTTVTTMERGVDTPLTPPGGPRAVDWDWSPDLTHAAWAQEIADDPGALLRLGGIDGADPVTIDTLGSSLDFRGRAFSNDGTRFAYAVFTADGTDLRVIDVADPQPSTVAHWEDADDVDVDWSPDGSQIVVGVAARGAQGGIFTMRPDGSDVVRISELHAWRVAWSPAGPFVAAGASETVGGVEGIYVMGADGSNARRLSPPDVTEIQPAWSPDGGWIAFASHRDPPAVTPKDMRDQSQFGTGIYIARPDGSDVRRIAPAPTDVGWAEVWTWLSAAP